MPTLSDFPWPPAARAWPSEMPGSSRSLTTVMAVLDRRGGVDQRRPCDPVRSALTRTIALRRTAALGRKQLAGAERPLRGVRGIKLVAAKQSLARASISAAPTTASSPTRAGRLADCGCREQSPARAASKLTLSIAATRPRVDIRRCELTASWSSPHTCTEARVPQLLDPGPEQASTLKAL